MRRSAPSDPLLLVEALLVLVFFALLLAFYLVPAARSPYFLPLRFAWLLLAVVLFAIVGLETWRRSRRDRSALDAALHEVEEEARERES